MLRFVGMLRQPPYKSCRRRRSGVLPYQLFLTVEFQLWVGVMIHTQPFFIGGLENVEEARSNAFGAMGMFLVTFVASMIGIWYDSQFKSEVVVDSAEAEYQLSTDQPTYGATN